MTASVRTTLEADRQVLAAELWWAERRPLAASALADELVVAFERLRWFPKLGRLYKARGVKAVRRLFLSRTRYHLYYVYNEDAKEVVIFSLWSAVRGKGPPLHRIS